MQACNLHLHPFSSSSSSTPLVSSVLFDSSSRSLALMLSDSSILLYSSFPVPPSTSPPPAPTTITPVSTAACFLRLNAASYSHVLFLSAAPHAAGSKTFLRAWIRRDDRFLPIQLLFRGEQSRDGVAIGLRHGFAVRVSGAVNVFVVHSVADAKIWVFAARMAEESCVELMKCAVVDCVLPIYALTVSAGFLLLGEVGGVRVLPLRPLVKGRVGKRRDLERKVSNGRRDSDPKTEFVRSAEKKKLPNGLVKESITGSNSRYGSVNCVCSAVADCNEGNCAAEQKVEKSSHGHGRGSAGKGHAPTKLRTVKLKQNSCNFGSSLVEIKAAEVQGLKSKTGFVSSLKAVAMHQLSMKKFLIVDSVGDVHLLSMQYSNQESNVSSQMRRLNCTMKVQLLAVFPDASPWTQIVWVSDASYSVHVMSLADVEMTVDEEISDENRQKPVQLLATDGIFTSEKIYAIVPLAANVVLILGQGNMFAYAAA